MNTAIPKSKEPRRCLVAGCENTTKAHFCKEHRHVKGAAIYHDRTRKEHTARPEPRAGASQCTHLLWYTGTDDFIERMVPGFHKTHEYAGLGGEWHYCRQCGHARLFSSVLDQGGRGLGQRAIVPPRWRDGEAQD